MVKYKALTVYRITCNGIAIPSFVKSIARGSRSYAGMFIPYKRRTRMSSPVALAFSRTKATLSHAYLLT